MQRLETVDETAISRADAAPDDVDAQLAAADLLLASNDVQGALDRLLAAVTEHGRATIATGSGSDCSNSSSCSAPTTPGSAPPAASSRALF